MNMPSVSFIFSHSVMTIHSLTMIGWWLSTLFLQSTNQCVPLIHLYFHLAPEPHVSVLILNIIMHSFMGCWRSTCFMKLCSLSQMSLSLQILKLFSVLVLQQCTYLNIVIFNHLCPWFHVHSR